METVLFILDTTIKERTGLHTNIDSKLILPDIKIVQDMFIEPILGTNLYEKIEALISSNEIILPENSEYKTLLDKYIVDAMVYYTLSRLPQGLSYQLWNKGLMRKSDDNSSLPTMGEIIDIGNDFKNTAEFYGQKLLRYLRANAAKFPELYTNYGLDSVTPVGDNYTIPIWLDDNENDCCCYNWGPYKP